MLHAEAFGLAHRGQQMKVATAVAAEAEVIAHHQVAHAQPLDQHPLDEGLGGQAAQGVVERQAEHTLHPRLAEQPHLVAQAGKPRWRLVFGEELAGLWLEHHHRHRQAETSGLFATLLENRLMPAMDAIEVTDGGHAATMLVAQVVQSSNHLHGVLEPRSASNGG